MKYIFIRACMMLRFIVPNDLPQKYIVSMLLMINSDHLIYIEIDEYQVDVISSLLTGVSALAAIHPSG